MTVEHCQCEDCLSSQTRTSQIPSGGETPVRLYRRDLWRAEDEFTRKARNLEKESTVMLSPPELYYGRSGRESSSHVGRSAKDFR